MNKKTDKSENSYFVGAGLLNVFSATLVGGLSISVGILTFSRGVMETVGKKLVRLDPFSAWDVETGTLTMV